MMSSCNDQDGERITVSDGKDSGRFQQKSRARQNRAEKGLDLFIESHDFIERLSSEEKELMILGEAYCSELFDSILEEVYGPIQFKRNGRRGNPNLKHPYNMLDSKLAENAIRKL
jgi:hypothetical protein